MTPSIMQFKSFSKSTFQGLSMIQSCVYMIQSCFTCFPYLIMYNMILILTTFLMLSQSYFTYFCKHAAQTSQIHYASYALHASHDDMHHMLHMSQILTMFCMLHTLLMPDMLYKLYMLYILHMLHMLFMLESCFTWNHASNAAYVYMLIASHSSYTSNAPYTLHTSTLNK